MRSADGIPSSVSLPVLPTAQATTSRPLLAPSSPASAVLQLQARLASKQRKRVRVLLESLDDGSGTVDVRLAAEGLRDISLRLWPPLSLGVDDIIALLAAIPLTPTGLDVMTDGGSPTGESVDRGGVLAGEMARQVDGEGTGARVPIKAVMRVLTRGKLPPTRRSSPRRDCDAEPELNEAEAALARDPRVLPSMRIVWPKRSTYSGELMVEELQRALINSGARTLDLLRSWDKDGDHHVNSTEFREALVCMRCPPAWPPGRAQPPGSHVELVGLDVATRFTPHS